MYNNRIPLSGIYGIIALLTLVAVFAAADQAIQTGWAGGPGEPGPVTTFGNTFDSSLNVNWGYNPGNLFLGYDINYAPTPSNIGTRTGDPYNIQADDLDNDGDEDIVISGHNSDVICFRNLGGGSFETDPILILSAEWPSATIVDFNANGYFDVVETDDAYIYAYYNKGNIEHPEWTIFQISDYFEQVDGTGAADFDDDGDVDIVGSCFQDFGLRWYENPDIWPPPTLWDRHDIFANYRGHQNTEIPVGDLNGDTLVDFVICREYMDELVWFENLGAPDYFTPASEHSIQTGMDGVRNADLGDLDADGDLDIVSVAIYGDTLDWFENDGSGVFTRHNISSSYNGAYDVSIGDIDFDGYLDIFSTANNGNTIDIWENEGDQNFAAHHSVLATGYSGASGVLIDDLDIDRMGSEMVTCNMNGSSNGSIDYWVVVDGYITNGELTSSIYDTGDTTNDWHTISWNANTPPNTTVKFQVRGSADPGNMGNWSSDIIGPGSLSGVLDPGDQYFQYKTLLDTADNAVTPQLLDVTFLWDYSDVNDEDPVNPTSFALGSAYPNPVTDFATISFALPRTCDVTLNLFDIKGRYKVAVGGLSGGLYLYTMTADEFTDTRKMVVK